MEDRYPEIRHMRKILRTWILPSFQSDTVWTLYANGDRSKFIIRRIAERKGVLAVVEQWENLNIIPWREHPFREADSDSPELKKAVSDLEETILPVGMKGYRGGLDGTTYGIGLTTGWTSIEAEWWEGPPTGWESFTDQVVHLQELLDACFEKSALRAYEHEWEVGRKTRPIHVWTGVDAANIKGLAGPFFLTLYDNGLLTDIPSIYRLKDHREELILLHAFGEEGVDQVLQEIQDSKSRPLGRIINGFLIKGLYGRAEEVARAFGSLEAFAAATAEQVEAISELSPQQVMFLTQWLSNEDNQRLIKDLIALGLRPGAPR